MTNSPHQHKPPTADPLQYASEHARRAASALLAIEPVFLTERERMEYARVADELLAIARRLQPVQL